ncbi:MAG: nitrogenase [Deltaproteobacteria bacterium]|jgi:nitrogenase molybdenum-iron protein beta chain|nr:nitrogenase [Deltaproteobacteria bacterium]
MALTLVKGSEGPLSAVEYPEVAEAPRFTCALGGAYGATLGLYGAVPLLHSGSGCGMANAQGMTYASGLNSGGMIGPTTTPCSGLVEEHVVFGGEDKLRRLIETTIQIMRGELYVVISGCVPALIGDDVDSVVASFRDRARVIHVKTSGFAGNGFAGYDLFLDSLVDNVLSGEKPDVEKRLVNILGLAPNQHVFWKGELLALKELFASVGILANPIFADFGSVAAVQAIPKAALNVVLSPWNGLAAARKLEERYGTPLEAFGYVPIGPRDTASLLRAVGRRLRLPGRKVEAAISSQERHAYRFMEYLAEMFMVAMPHAYTAVIADSRTAIALTRYGANELGWNPQLAVVTDDPPEDRRPEIERLLTEGLEGTSVPRVIFDYDSHRIRGYLREQPLQVIFGSSLEKYIAKRENESHHLSVAYPTYDRLVVDRSYAGFRGGIALLEDMSHSFAGPT